jgi:hypothetical protein
MGKHELKKKIVELSHTEISKVDIYNQLESEVAEKQKHWLVQQIISVINPELLKKYKPFNHALLLLLIVQYLFSFNIFVSSGSQINPYQILLTPTATIIYLLLMFGIYTAKLIAYNALIVLCTINIIFSLFYLLTPTWPDVIISDAVNISQVIYIIWLQNRLFPEVETLRHKNKCKNRNVLHHA